MCFSRVSGENPQRTRGTPQVSVPVRGGPDVETRENKVEPTNETKTLMVRNET